MSQINLSVNFHDNFQSKSPIPANKAIANSGKWNEDEFSKVLDPQMDFDKIFSIVKRTVKLITGKSRSGIGLALSNLPAGLGAFWQIGGNYIVMNEILLNAMKQITKSNREFNSFVYVILAHEYLHSVGYIDEAEARNMTSLVAQSIFGKEHPATVMSSGDLWRLYPVLLSLGGGDGSILKIVSKFDMDSTSYIT